MLSSPSASSPPAGTCTLTHSQTTHQMHTRVCGHIHTLRPTYHQLHTPDLHTQPHVHIQLHTHTHTQPRAHSPHVRPHTYTHIHSILTHTRHTHTHPDPSVHSPHLLSHTHTPSHPHTHTLVYKGTGGCALAVEGREQHGRAALSAPAPQTAGAMDHRDGTSEVSGLRGHPSVLSRAHPLSSGSPRQPVVWPEAEPGAPNHRRRSPSADASLGSGGVS